MRRLRKLSLLLLLLVLIALLHLRCGTENPFSPLRGKNEVWIHSTGFDPAELTISAGETVKWVNKDNTGHDVTSGTPGNVANDFPGSPPLTPDDPTYSCTFPRQGRFPYFCSRHPAHRGVIIVQ